jgi:uncharacterized membrane protein (DUF2068 family)
LSLLHHDAARFAVLLLRHLHLNPASQYPKIFIMAASRLNDARLWLFASVALAYAAVCFIEA